MGDVAFYIVNSRPHQAYNCALKASKLKDRQAEKQTGLRMQSSEPLRDILGFLALEYCASAHRLTHLDV